MNDKGSQKVLCGRILQFLRRHCRKASEYGLVDEMTPAENLYTSDSLANLSERTEYEALLLETVYEMVGLRIAAGDPELFSYPPNGSRPVCVKYATTGIRIGDWRGSFLKEGAPLVFMTTFKLLDMLIEWVLVQNGSISTHRFADKIKALAGPVQFPTLVESRPWLRKRLCALYSYLDPFRGTIIHDRRFTSANGSLEVSSTRGKKNGPAATISEADLRNLSLVLVSVIRYLQTIWTIDAFEEKRLRRSLDELTHLHKLPSLGQLPPIRLTVRLFVWDEESITFDIAKVRSDVAAKFTKVDGIFDVLLLAVARDGTGAKAYRIPWDELQHTGARFQEAQANLANHGCVLPEDLDIAETARDLSRTNP